MLALAHQGYHRGKTTRGTESPAAHPLARGRLEDLSVDLPLAAPDRVRYPEALLNRVRLLVATMPMRNHSQLQSRRLLSARVSLSLQVGELDRYRYDIPHRL